MNWLQISKLCQTHSNIENYPNLKKKINNKNNMILEIIQAIRKIKKKREK